MQHPFFSTINWEDIYNKRVSSLYFRKVNVNLTYQIHVRVYVTSHPSSYPSFDHQFSTLVPTKQHRILISLGATTLAKKMQKFRLKVKWNSNFPENLFGNCRLLPEGELFFLFGKEWWKFPLPFA